MKKEIESFDYFKAIACCFVILIHCQFPGYMGNLFRTIAKFSVPFFYMISGYFFLYRNHEYSERKTKNKIVHVLKLIICSELFYLIFTLIMYNCFYHQELPVREIVTPFNIAKFLFVNSPALYSHLWFLGSLLYCYIFSFFMKEKICGNWKMAVTILCICSFTIMSEIIPKFSSKPTLFGIVIYNAFVFRSLPFFLLGMILRENEEVIRIKIKNYPKTYFLFAAISGIMLSVVERIILVESQFYIGTYIVVITMFIFCMVYQNDYNKIVCYIGRELSMYVYILHIAVIKMCDLIQGGQIWDYIKPVLVITISILISEFIVEIKKFVIDRFINIH